MYPQVPDALSHLKFKRINHRKCYFYEDKNVIILKSYNTIVAAVDKITKNAYIDEYHYSGFTGQHISFFLNCVVASTFTYKYYIKVCQKHLIHIIIRLLSGIHSGLVDIQFKYKENDLVKLYRLHNRASKIVQIVRPGNTFTYIFNIEKDNNEEYLTPLYYQVRSLGPNKKYDTILTKNLKPLGEGGI